MKNKWMLLVLTAVLAGGVSVGASAKDDKDHKGHKESKDHKSYKDDRYDSYGKDLPPGLEKKVAKGEPLPPGWQKKYRRGDIMDLDIFDRGVQVGPIGIGGEITIRIDDQLFKVHDKTRRIIDIITE
ncbi:hypothetical protein KJI95_14295 [Shewanella sp. JM162201]|uniref:RcnB family protein n=1 Tax=Shewanella jiangmenensis TaxID=2837387 RepID=A0ABS5V7P4_9GAMM|nr:hypothetical protein [Shewanella jiangmenensis]MBT1445681.1 hypothetical protein [Shewanella jiangmenensis]